MFCPQCGQRQISNEARFCPSCGFPLEVVGEVLTNGGRLHWRPPPQQPGPQELSPRQRGIRQGAMVMLTVLLVVPLLAIFGVALLGLPGEIVALAAVGLPTAGFLRIMYAILFESNAPALPAAPQPSYIPPPTIPNYLGTPQQQQSHTLPPRQAMPTPTHARPQRYNTGELVEPPRASVTDHTTRLLDKQPQPDEPTRMLDRQPDEPTRQ